MNEKKRKELFELKNEFNDKVMREFGLDISEDNDYLYWINSATLITLKDKYIKYCEDDYPILQYNEIQMNLLENPRLMETLAYIYLNERVSNEIIAISQDVIKGSNNGHFTITYDKNGSSVQMSSDAFVNDSVRVFNLICKINRTEHLYNFKKYDIPVPRYY